MYNLFSGFSGCIMSGLMLLSLVSGSMVVFWALMELSGFLLMYLFLKNVDKSKSSLSSFMFYLSKGMSSMFIMSGCYLNSQMLMFFGLSCKFFVFPFSLLLFYMFENSSWMMIFFTGTLFKGLVLCLTYMSMSDSLSLSSSMVSLSLMVVMLLCYPLNAKGLWFVLNISSSVVLFMSCWSLSNDWMIFIYMVYLMMSLMKIYCLSSMKYMMKNTKVYEMSYSSKYLVSMVGFPVSVKILYKMLSSMMLMKCASGLFIIMWGAYVMVETSYLLYYFSGLLESYSVNY